MQLKWHRISCRFFASEERGGAGSGTGRMQDAGVQPSIAAAVYAAAAQHTASNAARIVSSRTRRIGYWLLALLSRSCRVVLLYQRLSRNHFPANFLNSESVLNAWKNVSFLLSLFDSKLRRGRWIVHRLRPLPALVRACASWARESARLINKIFFSKSIMSLTYTIEYTHYELCPVCFDNRWLIFPSKICTRFSSEEIICSWTAEAFTRSFILQTKYIKTLKSVQKFHQDIIITCSPGL